MSSVRVSTLSYTDFVKRYQQVEIPDYQRPYRWNKEKVEELLSDLDEFFITKPKPGLDYYMGGILLYDNKAKNCFEIIDGQQRLTTLNLLYYVLNDQIQAGQNFKYNNHLSFRHIKENVAFLKERKEKLENLLEKDFLKKLLFTVIESTNEDQSFAFFDSQNNRGVTLAADDYLKAYHLREVDSEQLQSTLAQEWERAAIKAQSEKSAEKGLLHLFYKVLYRSREWKGQNRIVPENKDAILTSFQKRTLEKKGNSYRLFRGKDNLRFSRMEVAENEQILPVSSHEAEQEQLNALPFSIRQPLYKGLNFFQFTQKYYAIHQLLFYSKEEGDASLETARSFYRSVYNNDLSVFLRHYMQLCLVMYYDSFGTQDIDKAVQYFDYFMGSIRVEKHYVRQEAIKNSLINGSNNLLDVIANAYLADEVFDFIKSQAEPKRIYTEEKLPADGGVRHRYKKRVLDYYKQEESSLKKRLEWIR